MRRLLAIAALGAPLALPASADDVLRTGQAAGAERQAATPVPITGHWDFDDGGLGATVGSALEYLDGPDGATAQGTRFGTTASLGVPDIQGQPARIMRVPPDLRRDMGYLLRHDIAPNGGGTRVNRYTLIMDLFVVPTGPAAASLLQVSSRENTDDGDLFWRANQVGQGANGYRGRGTFTAGTWHRVAVACDLSAMPPVVVKYVDGVKQDDWTANQGLDHPRRSLANWGAILFADGDEDERRELFVNSIQIRNGRLADADLALLGGPSADGIPRQLPASSVTGQWDFEFADLGATIGSPLEYFDGPHGLTQAGTRFGITGTGGLTDIPPINGEPAHVMRVPGEALRNLGYVMEHRIPPTGGGTLVNQYTLIMDLYVAPTGPAAAALLQISSMDNTDDGDLFWRGNQVGQGAGGYVGRGTFTAGAWHRVALAYDLTAHPPVVVKYVDGIKQDEWTTNQGLDHPRRALQRAAILFADGDEDERRELWVNSIQIRAGRLADAELAALGGPSSAGVPIATPQTTVTGQWDFEFGDLGASVGRPLAYLDGPEGCTRQGTRFGTTGEEGFADVPSIHGKPAKVMYVPGDLDRHIGYVLDPLIPPDGRDSLVRQYTLIMDVLVGTTGPPAAAMLQLSSSDNTDDADLFWRSDNFGQGQSGYRGTGIFRPGQWHRVVAAYDLAVTPPVVVKYVDGILQDEWKVNQGSNHPRRVLRSTAILFGDGDQDERREWWVNAIQIRAGRLSNVEIESLGGPSAHGIPVVLGVSAPPPPPLAIAREGTAVTVSWSPEATGSVLESTPMLLTPIWRLVPGVVSNSVTLDPARGAEFFRLRQ